MPTISMFQGIIIRMYTGSREHQPPHIHAWIELRREELMADWELARLGLDLLKIAPLA